ncbi:hypothetical protein niasHS_016403 [Heterodera schachtii]|uniref:JAB1/MPN/MOV34 metalloenzyme domain-containing protein n=1 Tax=Heterodera schachtii TaxID=97005 RepID=A0ABD2HPI0_HETSC
METKRNNYNNFDSSWSSLWDLGYKTSQGLAYSVGMACPTFSSFIQVVGLYHSHPGYVCRLSGIDVNTQSINQQFQAFLSYHNYKYYRWDGSTHTDQRFGFTTADSVSRKARDDFFTFDACAFFLEADTRALR